VRLVPAPVVGLEGALAHSRAPRGGRSGRGLMLTAACAQPLMFDRPRYGRLDRRSNPRSSPPPTVPNRPPTRAPRALPSACRRYDTPNAGGGSAPSTARVVDNALPCEPSSC
jgi:hypothetical protein